MKTVAKPHWIDRERLNHILFMAFLVAMLSMTLPGCSSIHSWQEIISSNANEVNAQYDDVLPMASNSQEGITEVELQEQLQSFADRYIQLIVPILNKAINEGESNVERKFLHVVKASYSASVVSMAASANPVHGLRDILVMVRLQQLVYGAGVINVVPETRLKQIHDALVLLDQQIISLAEKILPTENVQSLIERIDAWHEANLNKTNVAYIRFHNLDHSNGTIDRHESSSLFAPVSEVAREINETRKIANRAMFLANHMPMLIEWRGELMARRILSSPEAEAYMDESKAIRDTVQQVTIELSKTRERISTERQYVLQEMELYRPLLQQLSDDLHLAPENIAREREAILKALRENSVYYQPMLTQVENISSAIQDSTLSFERLFHDMEQDDGNALQEFYNHLDKLVILSKHLNQTVTSIQSILNSSLEIKTLEDIDRRVVEHEQRVLMYLIILALLIAILTIIVRVVWVKIRLDPH